MVFTSYRLVHVRAAAMIGTEEVAPGTGLSGKEDPTVDIVAVHGLNPLNKPDHAFETWRKQRRDGTSSLWLQDQLPKAIPNARILIYGYNSSPVFGGDKERFVHQATDLLENVRIDRKKDEKRPLVLIGHSLGGILIKQALVSAHNNPKYKVIKDSTSRVLWDTQRRRSQSLVALAKTCASIVKTITMKPSKDIMKALGHGSLFSDVLQDSFRHQLTSYRIISFYEGVGEIVTRSSAVSGILGDELKLDASHGEMCRFDPEDKKDQKNYRIVQVNISELCEYAVECGEHQVDKQGAEDVNEVRSWLTSVNVIDSHSRAVKLRQEGTGRWFVEGEAFGFWLKSDKNAFLWVHGIPGAGKTVLASTIIDAIQVYQQKYGTTLGFAYFYCQYNDQAKQEPLQVLGSISAQIASQNKSTFHVLAQEFRKLRTASVVYQNIPPESDFLVDVIKRTSKNLQQTLLVIDALDECRDRASLVNYLKSMYETTEGTVKILITSRVEYDIENVFRGLPQVPITGENTRKDIELYVRTKIEERIRLRPNWLRDSEANKGIILSKIGKRADGMFLLANHHLELILQQRNNKDIKNTLDSLPAKIDNIYTSALKRIEVNHRGERDSKETLTVLRWLTEAMRPLKLCELTEAIAVFEGQQRMDFERVMNEPERLTEICGSLVRVDYDTDEVYLAHYSLKEFLVSERILWPENAHVSHYHLDIRETNEALAKTCLTYLLFEDFAPICKSRQELNNRRQDFRFLDYATQYGGEHLKDVQRSSNKVIQLLNQLFVPEILLANIPDSSIRSRLEKSVFQQTCTLYCPPVGDEYYGIYRRLPEIKRNGLKARALDSHQDSLSTLEMSRIRPDPDESSFDRVLNVPRFNPQTQLAFWILWFCSLASQVWSYFFSRFLSKTNITPSVNNTSVASAVAKNNPVALTTKSPPIEDQLSDLLRRQTISQTSQRLNGLSWLQLYRILALTDRQDHHANITPLYFAALFGWRAGVDAILHENRARVSTSDLNHALRGAAIGGFSEIIEMILRAGADIDVHPSAFGSALQSAAFCSNTLAVETLLRARAKVEEEDSFYRPGGTVGSALQSAAMKGNQDLVKKLIDHGANVNSTKGWLGTPLTAVLERDMEEMAKFLIDNGSDASIVAGYYGSAMIWDSHFRGSTDVLAKMLENSSPNVNNPPYGDSLQTACNYGCQNKVKLLLENDADINAHPGQYGDAIQSAAMGGDESIVAALLDYGADPNSQAQILGDGCRGPNLPYYGRAVILEGGLGFRERFRTQFDVWKDLDTIWDEPFPMAGFYGPALKAAVRLRTTAHNKVLMLLEHEPTHRDGHLGNPLQAAAFIGNNGTLKALLERPGKKADVNAVNGIFGTALQAAAFQGNDDAIRILLQHGADPKIQGGFYSLPLLAAAAANNRKSIQLLIDTDVDLEASDEHGWTARDWAVHSRKASMLAIAKDEELSTSCQAPGIWCAINKSPQIAVEDDGFNALFLGSPLADSLKASIMANHPVPTCGHYYFEIYVISSGIQGVIAIGLCEGLLSRYQLPGLDTSSWAYHGDDGHCYSERNVVRDWPKFQTGDTIGCGVDWTQDTLYFTLNGVKLEGAVNIDVGRRLFPTLGMQSEGARVRANFGSRPFRYKT